jgi:XTP/dITP diphosphohydrolase
MELLFATNNKHKIHEISKILGQSYRILSLKDVGFSGDIPEEKATLEENALQKAEFIYNRFAIECFADDTGLEIDALGGEPGVYSARYAGNDKNSEANMDKVLRLLEGKENRTARFRTVISLIFQGKKYAFEGKVEGKILREKRGNEGFGYDPIFQPDGYEQTFAEMPLSVKNKISHRSRAIRKLTIFLDKHASDF